MTKQNRAREDWESGSQPTYSCYEVTDDDRKQANGIKDTALEGSEVTVDEDKVGTNLNEEH